VSAESHRSGGGGGRAGGGICRCRTFERGLRRLRLVSIERRLQRPTLAPQAGELDQRLTSRRIELAVIAGDTGDLAGDRVCPCLQRGQERGQRCLLLREQLSLRLEGASFGLQRARHLELAHGDLLQVDRPVQQVVEAARRDDELEPSRAAQLVDLADVGAEAGQVLLVGELVVR